MVLHLFPDGQQIFYEEFLYDILRDSKKDVKDDNDLLIIIAGRPGVGKSVLAMQICKLLDPDFNITQVVFRSEDLIKKSLELGPYKAIMWDEAREGISSDAALSKKNKMLMDFMAEVRQRNQFHVWCMPDFWEFQMPIATRRSDFFIAVYKEPNPEYDRESNRSNPFQRGHYEFYGFTEKRRLYIDGKKYHNYAFKGTHGRYSGAYVVDQELYRKMKAEAIRAGGNKDTERLDEKKYIKSLIFRMNNVRKLSIRDIAYIINKGQTFVAETIRELKASEITEEELSEQ